MRPFTLYTAPCRGDARNTHYPEAVSVQTPDDLARAVTFDHVAALFEGGRRSCERFILSNCIMLDMDNTHTEDPSGWKGLADIQAAFPGVEFYAVESRNHMKPKGNKAPRPKYHLYFPVASVNDANAYEGMKQRAASIFPWFDSNAVDAARFFFGVDTPKAHCLPGSITLDAFLLCFAPPAAPTHEGSRQQSAVCGPGVKKPVIELGVDVQHGERNKELYRFAFLRYVQGISPAEVQILTEAANACFSDPLEQEEVNSIVQSACKNPRDREANLRRAELAMEFASASTDSAEKPKSASVVSLAGMEERQPEWLIEGLIPLREITLLAGDGGVGKTFCWCSIAAGISAGVCPSVFMNPFATEPQSEQGKSVLYLSSEDDTSAVLLPRLRASGADLDNILTVECTDDLFQQLRFGSSALERVIEEKRPALVIFDPLQSFLPLGTDMSARNQMRHALGELHGLGAKYGTTFLIILHTNKGKGVWGRTRIADSADLWDIARSVLMCGSADSDNHLRYLSHEKCSYGPQSQTTLFRIENNAAAFFGTSDKRDRDFVLSAAKADDKAPERESAERFILEVLEERSGKVYVNDLDAAAKGNMIAPRTLRRAKEALKQSGKIKTGKDSGGWFILSTWTN